MKCAENVANIYMAEIEKRRPEDNFLSLTPRKGRTVEKSVDLSPIKGAETQEVLKAWNTFHENAEHKTYADFYSKIFYCQNFADLSAGPDTFLKLIADREFLFFEYSESYTPPDFPPLSHLVKSPNAETHNYPEEKRNMVLEQAFVPTKEHHRDYRIWKQNFQNLEEARLQRIHHLELFPEIPNPFSIKIHTFAETDITDLEMHLSILLCSYLQAFQEVGGELYNRPVEDIHMIWNV